MRISMAGPRPGTDKPRNEPMTGRDTPRADSRAKVTGKAKYVADIARAGMLTAKVLRSPHAHARIVSINAEAARVFPGVHAVVTRDDIAGLATFGTFLKDQPIVATDRVRYVGDIVAGVAAEDEHTALAALDLIEVTYEQLPAVFDAEESLSPDSPVLFPEPQPSVVPHYGMGASGAVRTDKNVSYEFRYTTGDPAVWDECEHIFEDEFHFSRMNHLHLEPFVSVAEATEDSIEIWTANQAPFQVRKDLSGVFHISETKIQVNTAFLGGGFGGKTGLKGETMAVRLSQLAGGRAVRFAMTTEEVFLTNRQHNAVLRYRTGVMADGTFVARHARVILDAGAYSDLSPLVTEKAGYRTPGAYRWKHIDSAARSVLTNTVPAGAYRGFGGTQATWASERQVDLIAERLGMSPYEIRMKNLKDLGEQYVPGESEIDSDLREGLDLVADAIGFHERERSPGRGMGVVLGIKDGGGVNKPAMARVKITSRGDVLLSSALTEMGQGGHSALCQLVAEVLGCQPHRVTFAPINTSTTPFDNGTHSSSGIAVMGQAVTRAAERVRDQILHFAADQLNVPAEELELQDWTVRTPDGTDHPLTPLVMGVFGGAGFEFSADGFFKAENSDMAPLEAPCVFWEIGWAAAEVEVDEETGKVSVLQLVVSGDAGRAINKLACRGQDEGAAVFGLGQALFEELRYDNGELINGEALLYRHPLAEDIPELFTGITQEQGHGRGPFGAKGMGEGAMLPVAPAIAQAIADAVGVQLKELPFSPHRAYEAIQRRNQEETQDSSTAVSQKFAATPVS